MNREKENLETPQEDLSEIDRSTIHPKRGSGGNNQIKSEKLRYENADEIYE
ncbi:hypothetical protein [Paenibacillus mendelii]|uniref:Multidrug transporter n=1 Tax=Paenibacillus mendelii TaxID=206163 RepID=A0ABV6JE04_9BACL|nr:hypothetical protein [Paenibacillus mendelii]MCQ6562557.1 hypothetical protein [Paenibacillus mendelii]